MHFERHFAFQNAYNNSFPEKKLKKNICANLPKSFKPVTRNTLICLFGLIVCDECEAVCI